MNFIKTLFAKQKLKHQQAKELDISSNFYIKEKDNYLWILHNGHAIQQISSDSTAEEIVNILNNYRKTAINY